MAYRQDKIEGLGKNIWGNKYLQIDARIQLQEAFFPAFKAIFSRT